MPGPHAAAEAARAIAAREVDLIIGTQIVAKGWHFPHLTLVGVVDADLGLGGGDLRAAERTVQLLHQVAGRAGRAEAPGTGAAADLRSRASGDAGAAGRRPRRASWRARPGSAGRATGRRIGRLAALIVSAETAAAADTAARDLGARGAARAGDRRAGPGAGAARDPARPPPPAAAAEDAAGHRGAAVVARMARKGATPRCSPDRRRRRPDELPLGAARP